MPQSMIMSDLPSAGGRQLAYRRQRRPGGRPPGSPGESKGKDAITPPGLGGGRQLAYRQPGGSRLGAMLAQLGGGGGMPMADGGGISAPMQPGVIAQPGRQLNMPRQPAPPDRQMPMQPGGGGGGQLDPRMLQAIMSAFGGGGVRYPWFGGGGFPGGGIGMFGGLGRGRQLAYR